MSTLIAWFAFPIIFRLIEYRPNCVRIPERIAGIPIKVCKSPVTQPATIPARSAANMATHTFCPFNIIIMQTAPPVHKEPSTVRSAKSSIRNVI